MNKVEEIIELLSSVAPLHLQASYDNSGLLVGHSSNEVKGVLVALDCTEEVIQEALEKSCNTILTHHPIIFQGIKKLNGRTEVERVVAKAIKYDLNLIAWHTNLDQVIHGGVNGMIAEKLMLKNVRALQASSYKLFCSVLADKYILAEIESSLADPFATKRYGNRLIIELTSLQKGILEERLQEILEDYDFHYEFLTSSLHDFDKGYGLIGELEERMSFDKFLDKLSESMSLDQFKHTKKGPPIINKVALCGGSGSFLISNAIAAGADCYISADIKYHDFFEATDHMCIMDIGHYESEKFTIELLHSLLSKKFSTFAVLKTDCITNPVEYYHK